jgi:hypothetical protein
MQKFISEWKRIGTSNTVLTWIEQGVPVPLLSNPEVFEIPNHNLDQAKKHFLRDEINRLKARGYVSECSVKPRFISPIGCVPKKSGGYRLITDLRHLNSFCQSCKFKQEDIRNVASILKPGDYLTSVDLQDGFYHIPIRKEDTEFFSFQFEGRYFSFQVLPFGFCLSPYFFAKILRPVVKYLRELGIRLSLYVDDFCICASVKEITDHTDLVVSTLEDLGIKINYDKSVLTSSQTLHYLGYTIDTSGKWPVIKADKLRVSRIKRNIRKLLHQGQASARVIAKVAGLCVSVAWAVTPGKLFLRHIYRLLACRTHWNDILYLNEQCICELRWWLSAIDSWNYQEIKPGNVDLQIETDASHFGWGAKLGTYEAKGDWNKRLSCRSSNYRELLAILLALIAFKNVIRGLHVQILTDNVCATAYVNHKGGPSPDLTQLAIAVWSVATEYGLTISCKHLAGINNSEADRLSRTQDSHNWMLHPRLFQRLDHVWGPHTIDRFATFENTQLARFNSRYWEPLSEAVDALAQFWGDDNNFINPPWALLPRILDKVIMDNAQVTLIAPMWPSQPWYQKLTSLLVTEPIFLPQSKNTFQRMGISPEPWKNKGWKIFAWRISGMNV